MKKGIILFTVLLLVLYPFCVFADVFYQIVPHTETVIGTNSSMYWNTVGTSSEVRAVCLYNGTSYRIGFATKDNNAQIYIHANNGSITTQKITSAQGTDNGQTVYCYMPSSGSTSTAFSNYYATIYGYQRDSLTEAKIFYYTYGEGSQSARTFGDLNNLGFYTKFTNSQQSNISQMALNKDVITWDKYQDTAGNDLNDINLRVDIQAATIDYEANTKSDLLNQTINDMVTGAWSDLITISPNVGTYETTWQNVASALWGTNNITINFWNSLFNVFDSAQGVFYKNGWIYRIRLRTQDNSYVGDWQIIYNVTSAPPSDSDKVYTNYYIYNYTVPDPETYQIIQNINNINNTENNWYQNDTPFNPDQNNNTDMSWIAKLIEAIISLFENIAKLAGDILDFLGGLIHDLLGLFTFDNFDIPDFEEQQQNPGYRNYQM